VNQHHKNGADIIIGLAVVPYCNDNSDNERVSYDERTHNPGWVLPGGEKTSNKALAISVAEKIDKLIKKYNAVFKKL
jgi:hypothetical protein